MEELKVGDKVWAGGTLGVITEIAGEEPTSIVTIRTEAWPYIKRTMRRFVHKETEQ